MCQDSTCSKPCDFFYPAADVIAQGHGGPECKRTQENWRMEISLELVDKHRISLKIYNAPEKGESRGSCFHEDNRKETVLESKSSCCSCTWPTTEGAVGVTQGNLFVHH